MPRAPVDKSTGRPLHAPLWAADGQQDQYAEAQTLASADVDMDSQQVPTIYVQDNPIPPAQFVLPTSQPQGENQTGPLPVRKGKKGMELLPHRTFWANLFGLVKDGCWFSFQKCKTMCSYRLYNRILF